MLYKSKVKKGSSLIEIIISMALLSILMIPLSSAIIQIVKTNKKGEIKQIASYEGQKILEEFKGYSEIKLIDNKFTLLNGHELEKVSSDKDQYKSNFKITNSNIVYDVNLSVTKEEAFDNTIKENKEKFTIDFNQNDKVIINNSEKVDSESNYMKIEISNDENNKSSSILNFYTISGESAKSDCSVKIKELETKEIIINIAKEYTNSLKIEIENMTSNKELNFEANVYKGDNEASRGIIDVRSIKGNNTIRVNRNLEVGANGILEQLYIIDVNVKEEGKEDLLFESSNTQNIIIN